MDEDHAIPPSRQLFTLSQLVHVLGAHTVELLAAPNGSEIEVSAPCIYDLVDPGAIGRGELVLGVNVGSAASAIAEAAAAGAAGIALKGDQSVLDDYASLAKTEGVALLGVATGVSWDQLYALIRNAASATGAGVDDAETPLGDLFALANALATVIGGAVTIEGWPSTLLAYSNLDQPIDEARRETILGRRTPGILVARLDQEGINQELMNGPTKVIHVSDQRGEVRDRLVTAVRAGAQLLGAIWVVEGDMPFDERAHTALEESAPLAALHLLRHRSSEDLTRKERGGLLQALLDGRRSGQDVASNLGVDFASPCAIVAFHLAIDNDLDLVVMRARASDLISVACEAFRRSVVCTGVGRTVYALLPSLDESGTKRLDGLVLDIAAWATDTLGVRVVAGVGSTVPYLSSVMVSRQEADRIVRVLCQGNGPGSSVARIEKVEAQSLLLELGDVLRGRPDLRMKSLDRVVEYDQKHGKSYMETLRALVQASWDFRIAAIELNLHPNSLRYRLKRMEELSGLDLEDPRYRLLLSLEFLT